MLTKDVRFEGWTTEDWGRLLSLWKSTPENGASAGRAGSCRATSGGLLVIHSGGRVRKILHTQKGRIEKDGETWPTPLAELAARHGARWVLSATAGGLEKIAERLGARCRREDDLSTQARLLLEIVRELIGAGIIEIWPNRIDRLALPYHPVLKTRSRRSTRPVTSSSSLFSTRGSSSRVSRSSAKRGVSAASSGPMTCALAFRFSPGTSAETIATRSRRPRTRSARLRSDVSPSLQFFAVSRTNDRGPRGSGHSRCAM